MPSFDQRFDGGLEKCGGPKASTEWHPERLEFPRADHLGCRTADAIFDLCSAGC